MKQGVDKRRGPYRDFSASQPRFELFDARFTANAIAFIAGLDRISKSMAIHGEHPENALPLARDFVLECEACS